MDIELKLRDYILSKYKSIRQFCSDCNIPYSTIDNIFRRGIMGSSLTIVAKVCVALHISLDALINGDIVQRDEKLDTISTHEQSLIHAYRSNPPMQGAVDKLLGLEPEHVERRAAPGDNIFETLKELDGVTKNSKLYIKK